MQPMTQEAFEKHQMSTYRENRNTYKRTALLISLFFGVTLFYFYSRRSESTLATEPNRKLSENLIFKEPELLDASEANIQLNPSVESSEKMDWKNVNLREQTLPDEVKSMALRVTVETGTKEIQGTSIFYREANIPDEVNRSGQCLLLLHGMAFKSETWVNTINTLQTLAAMGHRAVAIDLPGFGESPKAYIENRVQFLHQVMEAHGLDHPVVISPSMSGGWSIPFLSKNPELLGGYVPVAPVDTDRMSEEEYKSVQVPTLIVYGELDKGLGAVSYRNLKNIPTSKAEILPNANHPAYLDQTELWHQLLFNFMKKIKSSA